VDAARAIGVSVETLRRWDRAAPEDALIAAAGDRATRRPFESAARRPPPRPLERSAASPAEQHVSRRQALIGKLPSPACQT
jgi:transposase-like protein